MTISIQTLVSQLLAEPCPTVAWRRLRRAVDDAIDDAERNTPEGEFADGSCGGY